MKKVLVQLTLIQKTKMNNKFVPNRYVPKYCDTNLKWFDRNYDFIDLNKWEHFKENCDQYIKNVKIVNFDEIYRSIEFKPIDNSLKSIRQYQTVDSKMVNKIPQPKKFKAAAACIRSDRKEIFGTMSVASDHFLYRDSW